MPQEDPPRDDFERIYNRIKDAEEQARRQKEKPYPTIPVYDWEDKPDDAIEGQIALFENTPDPSPITDSDIDPGSEGFWKTVAGVITRVTTVAWSELTGIPSLFEPSAHKNTHKSGGSDELTSSDLLEAQVKRIKETSTVLTIAGISDGEYLKRSGSTIISDSPSGTGDVATDGIWDAKGDIAVGSGANAADNLPIGSTGQMLYADPGETLGIKWDDAPAGGSGGDGWTDDTAETWTYVSATTFTVPTDLTLQYTPGTRIKLTQTTIKYFVVLSSAFASGTTTVTITGGSDFTLANAAISNNYHSYVANPQGYPGWFTYAPTITGFSGTPTANVARFCVNGRLVVVNFAIIGTSNSTGFTITSPTPIANLNNAQVGVNDNGVWQDYPGNIYGSSSTVFTVQKTISGGVFTASGTKRMEGIIPYEM